MANGPLVQAQKQQMAFTSYETGFGHNQGVGLVGKSTRNQHNDFGIGPTGNSRNLGLGGGGNLVKSHQQIGGQSSNIYNNVGGQKINAS